MQDLTAFHSLLPFFEMRTVLQYDPRHCRRPQPPADTTVHTAAFMLQTQQRHCEWHQVGTWQQTLHMLQDHKFSAHNFFGLHNDCTVFTMFHYQPGTFAALTTTSRAIRRILLPHRRLAIRARIVVSTLAQWQSTQSGP